MEASTQYCSAPGADVDSRVVAAIFFGAADGRFAKISHLHGSQHNIVCNHYLREYPVLISGILSKEKVRMVRYFSSSFFNFNRKPVGCSVGFYHVGPLKLNRQSLFCHKKNQCNIKILCFKLFFIHLNNLFDAVTYISNRE